MGGNRLKMPEKAFAKLFLLIQNKIIKKEKIWAVQFERENTAAAEKKRGVKCVSSFTSFLSHKIATSRANLG